MADELEPTGEEQPQDAGADQPAGDADEQQTASDPADDAAGADSDGDAPDAMAEEALRAAREAVGSLGGGDGDDVASPAAAADADADEPVDDAAAAALAAVKAAIGDASGASGATTPASNAPLTDDGIGDAAGVGAAFDLPSFDELAAAVVNAPEGIDLLSDVDLNVKIELGRTKMLVEDVLRLGEGAVVELDKLAGDPVDVYVNERLVARGEVLVLNDNFCVRVNEVIDPDAERGGQKAG